MVKEASSGLRAVIALAAMQVDVGHDPLLDPSNQTRVCKSSELCQIASLGLETISSR